MKPLFVTTPIYYANGNVHGGNAYWSLTADIIARIWRLMGRQVKFSTWTDENWQKMTQAAEQVWKDVMNFLDEIAWLQRATWDVLQISYTDFIRTTHPTHKSHVQSMLQKSYDIWDVYQGSYDGLYCVGCEGFKKEWDLIDYEWKQVCPDHLKEPEQVSEKNRFFRLWSYQEFIEKFYATYPEFIVPSKRFNEVKAFTDSWLEDFSISRQWSSFGISMPFDESSVSYIWYDALFNYHTVCVYPQEFTVDWKSVSWGADDITFWNDADIVHCMGKDIVRFHGIYWPAMLESVGIRQPDHEVVTWFFTIDWQKMSKSLGNVIDPVATVEQYWRDALVYYLFSDIKVWNDWDFSWERFSDVYESTLKKWRWNLVARTLTLAKKADVKSVSTSSVLDEEFVDFLHAEWLKDTYIGTCMVWWWLDILSEYGYDGHTALINDRYWLIKIANKRIDTNEPWKLLKTDEKRASMILEQLIWRIKWCAVLSSPFLIDWYEKVKNLIQVDHIDRSWSNTASAWTNWQEIIDLQEFYITLWEWKYVY